MKSLSVKRIAATAIGAAFLGASMFAGAVSVDPNVGSFPFFANGEPNVKIVVGSRAAPSDAVAAGNIAAMLGNLAYTQQTVTINGKTGVTCPGGSGGTATCTVGSKSVELAVTTPGVNPATAFLMKTYINDNLDYNVDTTRNLTTSFDSTNTSFGSPAGPKQITDSLTAVLKPAGSQPADGKINNPKNLNIKESQRVYAFGFVNYDTTAKKVRSENTKTGYEVVFSDPLPYCLDTSKNSTTCTSDSDKLFKNSVRISFLGDVWTVMNMAVSTGQISTITLGKEVAYNPIMRVNDVATTPEGFTIKLVDLSGFGYGTGGTSFPRVSFLITDKNGKTVKQLTVDESVTGGTTVSEANNLVITVNKAFPGAFALEAYADVSIFSSKLDITDGAEVSGGDSHKNWKAEIVNTTLGSSEAIAKIQLYNDVDQLYKTPVTQSLYEGENIDIIKGMPGFKLNFLGLEKVEYDTLNFQVTKQQTLALNATSSAKGDFILVSSGRNDGFRLGTVNTNQVYVVPVGGNYTSVGTVPNATAGDIFYYDSATGYYTNATGKLGQYANLTYYYSATENAKLIFNITAFRGPQDAANGVGINQTIISVPEITEDANGTTADATSNNYQWKLNYDGTLRQFVNTLGSTTIDKIGYTTGGAFNVVAGNTSLASVEGGYTSYRGSVFNSASSSAVSINYASSIAHARFTLTPGTVAASANTATYTLNKGDTQDIGGGYSITVNDILADVTGTCSAGSGGSTGVDGLEGLTTTPGRAAVVTNLNTASRSLVVLDSAPSSSNLIVVGGHLVNTMASGLSGTLTAGSDSVLKVDGSKLYVAGYTAAGTQDAANALIAWMSDNRDQLTG